MLAHTDAHTHTCTHTHTHIHIHTHAHTYTHMYAHTHTYSTLKGTANSAINLHHATYFGTHHVFWTNEPFQYVIRPKRPMVFMNEWTLPSLSKRPMLLMNTWTFAACCGSLWGDTLMELKTTLKVVRTSVRYIIIYSKIENVILYSLP